MLPKVFLSLAGSDERFVDEVYRQLPKGLAYFFKTSFKDGGSLLDEMEKGVKDASIFALFVSSKTLEAKGVRFELDIARLQKLERADFRLLVFMISDDVSIKDFPNWMKDYWISSVGRSSKDVARYIRYIISDSAFGVTNRIIGRGALVDSATEEVYRNSRGAELPNLIFVPGIVGIGRRSVLRELLKKTYPTLPNLLAGPEFLLPQFADLGDMYRALHQEMENGFTMEEFQRAWEDFNNLQEANKIKSMSQCIEHFSSLGEAVTFVSGNLIFTDDGTLKSWVVPLSEALKTKNCLPICIITNRQIRENQLIKIKNCIQVFVPPLPSSSIQTIISSECADLDIENVRLPENLLEAIGGHPGIARSVVRLIRQFGPNVLSRDPLMMFEIQNEILSENLRQESLNRNQKSILCILSWVPSIRSGILYEVLATNDTEEGLLTKDIQDLLLSCLVSVSGSHYAISPAVRYMFRRLHGFGDKALLSRMSAVLTKHWELARSGDEGLSLEILDSVAYMFALEGRQLPSELSGFITPASLFDIVRDLYNRAREESSLYERVIGWGAMARSMNCDEGVREEILSYVVRAMIRRRKHESLPELFQFFSDRGYRSRSFLLGFFHRTKREYRDAIPFLREAVRIRKLYRSAVHELALCLKNTGEVAELKELIDSNADWLQDSAMLLDFLAGTKLASGEFVEVDRIVQRLSSLPDDDGRSIRRRAQLLMKRDRRFGEAADLLSKAIDRKTGLEAYNRATRAVAYIYSGQKDRAREDIAFVRRRMDDGEDIARRLDVHVEIGSGHLSKALTMLDEIEHPTPMDQLMKARIFELQANGETSPALREKLLNQAVVIRERYRMATDIDILSLA